MKSAKDNNIVKSAVKSAENGALDQLMEGGNRHPNRHLSKRRRVTDKRRGVTRKRRGFMRKRRRVLGKVHRLTLLILNKL